MLFRVSGKTKSKLSDHPSTGLAPIAFVSKEGKEILSFIAVLNICMRTHILKNLITSINSYQ